MPNGFRDSGIRMNQRISQKNAWGLPELEERNEELMARALTIWAKPKNKIRCARKTSGQLYLGR